MDTAIAQDLVTALTAGASFVATGLAKEAVHDAYEQFKTRMLQCYAGLQSTIVSVEEKPSSSQRALELQEDLEDAQVVSDGQLVALAQRLVELLRHDVLVAPNSIGVSIDVLDQVKARFEGVRAASNSIGVAIKKVTGGELHFGSVSAGGEKNV